MLSNPPFLISSPAPVPGPMSFVVCAWAPPVISAATRERLRIALFIVLAPCGL
jgi:hypothetical protein